MFALDWQLSPREHAVTIERNIKVEMSDGVRISVDLFRPASTGRFPAIVGVHAYDQAMQSAPSIPKAITLPNAQAEAGDPNFYVRRGYVHVIVNARGTGQSEGVYAHYSPREVDDVVEVIAWLAEQPWCTGDVGMFGASYFSVCAKQVAARNPPALKAVFGLYGYNDFYRDKFYHGGILAAGFLTSWAGHLDGSRIKGWSRDALGEDEYQRRLAELRADHDLMAIPALAKAITTPEEGGHPLIIDVLINSHDGPYWAERNPRLEDIEVPIMIGASWDMYMLHLPGEFRAWEKVPAPKKLIVGPPMYLDRPIYQYALESLRWFDHWLKGNDTGYLDEPAVNLYLMGSGGDWKQGHSWPLPETVWQPFYLHFKGLLSEHEHWPHEGGTSYEDNRYNERGGILFTSPAMVEETEVVGPLTATIYASNTQPELLLFLTLWDIAPNGDRRLLTRGWLRGSMRQCDESRSRPWLWHHDFTQPSELADGVPHRFDINLVPTANVFKQGHRIALGVSSSDTDRSDSFFARLGKGHVVQQRPSWVTIHHDAEHPSALFVPVVKGNRIGTFISEAGDLNNQPEF
ncbi:MAG: CocE/NonD family hydrolase [Sphingopyxis sp.]|uniref:CocE/NonD family hydrolase n=1 Tax=Sphingopyxis sp. TaxID=1908224 RepID=UPI001A3D1484|nr:CocE/NonD family hydrolase [Sphingopyxis sp.]MBL9071956.1 CocE/NonD family hydrolase [Sphingopyxis sp.]